MALVHEVPAEVQEVVSEWLGRFAVVWPRAAHAVMVRSGDAAVVREFAEALAGFPPGVIRNAAIDLRNTSEFFPGPPEWRAHCAQTVMRRSTVAVSDDTLPLWMQERIALQNARNDAMLAAVGAANASPREQAALLRRIVDWLCKAWERGSPEEQALGRDFTQYRPMDAENLGLWARFAVAEIERERRAKEDAEKARQAARRAQSLRPTQADTVDTGGGDGE